MAGSLDLTNEFNPATVPIHSVEHPLLDEFGVKLSVRRDDLLHPLISGNKWYKLIPYLKQSVDQQAQGIISFGGAYSNHLHALAYAGKCLGVPTLGLVRGELPKVLNPTLREMRDWGMELRAVSRSLYRERNRRDITHDLIGDHSWLIVPEGGAGLVAVEACRYWGNQIREGSDGFDVLCLACGTGASLAGIIAAQRPQTRVLGFSALRDGDSISQSVRSWLDQLGIVHPYWEILSQYAGPGFGRLYPELIAFLQNWPAYSSVPLEPVYTGKLLLGILALVQQGVIGRGQRILVIHTGGIQGARGMAERHPGYAEVILRASGLAPQYSVV